MSRRTILSIFIIFVVFSLSLPSVTIADENPTPPIELILDGPTVEILQDSTYWGQPMYVNIPSSYEGNTILFSTSSGAYYHLSRYYDASGNSIDIDSQQCAMSHSGEVPVTPGETIGLISATCKDYVIRSGETNVKVWVESILPNYCGDGVCDSDEDCDSCEGDCACSSSQCCKADSDNADSKGCVDSGEYAIYHASMGIGLLCCSGYYRSGNCCTDSDCSSGEKCVDDECESSSYCGNGVCDSDETSSTCPSDCVALKANGESCLYNSDCSSNNCENGVCCASGKTCCKYDFQCSYYGYECGSSNYCVKKTASKTNGESCSYDSDCSSDNCYNGVCCATGKTCCKYDFQCSYGYECGSSNYCVKKTALKSNGASCSYDSDCSSGNCDNGVCCVSGKECCKYDSKCPSGYECGDSYYCVKKTEDADSFEGRYKLYELSEALDFNETVEFCEGKGGHVLTITSEKENSYISSLLSTEKPDYTGGVFLGLTDRESEGTWRWITGEAFSYSHWHYGEPNNYKGEEDCGQFGSHLTPSDWNDMRCWYGLKVVICEFEGAETTAVLEKTAEESATAAVNIKNKDDDTVSISLYVDGDYETKKTLQHWTQHVEYLSVSPGSHTFVIKWEDPDTNELYETEAIATFKAGETRKVNLGVTKHERAKESKKKTGETCVSSENCVSGNCKNRICCKVGEKCCTNDRKCSTNEWCDTYSKFCRQDGDVNEFCYRDEGCLIAPFQELSVFQG